MDYGLPIRIPPLRPSHTKSRKVSHTGPPRLSYLRELTMSDKSPKKSSAKKQPAKSLKEKRADKHAKANSKGNGDVNAATSGKR